MNKENEVNINYVEEEQTFITEDIEDFNPVQDFLKTIQTIKDSGEAYVVNGLHHIPKNEDSVQLAAINEWIEIQGNEIENTKPKTISLTEMKQITIREFNSKIDTALENFLSLYPKVEQESFIFKKQESQVVTKTPDTPLEDTPVLTALIPVKTIEARNFLASKVMEKVDKLTKLEQFAVLTREQIKKVTTKKALKELMNSVQEQFANGSV